VHEAIAGYLDGWPARSCALDSVERLACECRDLPGCPFRSDESVPLKSIGQRCVHTPGIEIWTNNSLRVTVHCANSLLLRNRFSSFLLLGNCKARRGRMYWRTNRCKQNELSSARPRKCEIRRTRRIQTVCKFRKKLRFSGRFQQSEVTTRRGTHGWRRGMAGVVLATSGSNIQNGAIRIDV
jgi:hypothetical protein